MIEYTHKEEPKKIEEVKTSEVKEEYVEKHNLKLAEHDLKIVGLKWYTFVTIAFFAMFLIIVLESSFLLYEVSQGKFQSSSNLTASPVINPSFNSTVNNNYLNEYTPNISNSYSNNFSFNFNIDAQLIKRYCNQSCNQ